MAGSVQFLGFLLLLVTDEGFAVTDIEMMGGHWLERPISDDGAKLKMGASNEHNCFKDSRITTVNCEVYPDAPDKVEFETKVLFMRDGADPEQIKVSKYFFFLKKELWGCKSESDSETTIWRVEHELIGIDEIASIEHYDDLEVTTKYYLDSLQRTAWVREVAHYLKTRQPNGLFKNVKCKYEGKAEIKADTTPQPDNNLLPSGHSSKVEFDSRENGKFRNELNYFAGVPKVIQLNPGDRHPLVSMGYLVGVNEMGDKNSIAVCRRVLGLNPYPLAYRTKSWEVVVPPGFGTSTGTDTTVKVLIGEKRYFSYFIPIKEEVWKCNITSGTKHVGRKFIRIVNEMLCREPLSKVQFGHTVVSAEKIDLPPAAGGGPPQKGFKSKEIKYIYPVYGYPIRYNGWLKFVVDEGLGLQPKMLQGVREVSYRLDRHTLFKSFIATRGFDLRIGSRLEYSMGTRDSLVKCAIVDKDFPYNKAFETQIKLKTSIGLMAYATSRIQKYMEPEYYTYITKEVSQCTSDSKNGQEIVNFLRVMNVIIIEVPVHMIESYETVQVAYTYKAKQKRSTRIVEIKYLNPSEHENHGNFSVIRYDGVLNLDGVTKTPKFNPNVFEVRKTDDDMARIVGPYQTRYDKLKNIINYEREPYKKLIGSGKVDMTIGERKPGERIERNLNEVAECFSNRLTTSVRAYYTHIFLSSAPRKTFRQIYEEYFVPVSSRIWDCRITRKVDPMLEQPVPADDPKGSKTEKQKSGGKKTETKDKKRTKDKEGTEDKKDTDTETDTDDKKDTEDKPPETVEIFFLRVLNDVTFQKTKLSELRNLLYRDGDTVYYTKEDSGEYFLNMVNLFYEDAELIEKHIKFNGPAVIKEKEKEIDAKNFLSGTEQPLGGSRFIKRVYYEQPEYKLETELIYKTAINKAGVTLKLGTTKWQVPIPADIKEMTCLRKFDRQDYMIDSLEYFNTFFRTKVSVVDRQEVSDDRDLFEVYFDSLKQEYWECSPTELADDADESKYDENYKMLRIVNQFSVKQHHCDLIGGFHHYDGFTFMIGEANHDQAGCMEINEIKYLKEFDTGPPLVAKFEGVIKLIDENGEELSKTIVAERLKGVARKDTMYLIANDKTVFRKVVKERSGVVVALLNNPPVTVLPHASMQTRFKCEVIKDNTWHGDKVKALELGLEIKAILLIERENQPTKSDAPVDGIDDVFIRDRKSWLCEAKEDANTRFVRISDVYTLKTDAGQEVARVYYTDGVKVNVQSSDQTVQIEQVRYYDLNSYAFIKFDGFIADSGLQVDVSHHPFKPDVKDVEFYQDPVHFERQDGAANYFVEVGSPYITDITRDENDIALCSRRAEHVRYDPYLGMRIYSSRRHLHEAGNAAEHSSTSSRFEIAKQDFYDCSTAAGKYFFRVVNEIIEVSGRTVGGIFHHDGVTINMQTFPDKSQSMRIREVKYLYDDGNKGLKAVRFDGEITILSKIDQNVITLFQMPEDLKEYPIETDLEPSKHRPSLDKYWTMDVLRSFALRQDEKRFNIKEDEQRIFEVKDPLRHIKTTVIENGRNGRFLIGSPWQEHYVSRPEHGEFRCILDEWNPTNYLQFNTYAVVYIDDVHNILDEETILDFFKFKIDIWICVNKKDTILRVVTELEGIVPIQVVEHYEGVFVEPVPLSTENGATTVNENTAKITEYKYVDAITFKTLMIDGKMKLLESVPTKPRECRLKRWCRSLFGRK